MKKAIVIVSLLILCAMKTNAQQPYLTLNNGVQMPQTGLGLYMIPEGDVAYNSVMTALENGYRHFDCAHAYQN